MLLDAAVPYCCYCYKVYDDSVVNDGVCKMSPDGQHHTKED